MSATDALYQEIILEHNRKPRNFREMPDADQTIEGRNPNCGDMLTLWLKLDHGTIVDVSFKGQGCAISKASASLMTAAIKGKRVDEAEAIFERFHDMVTGKMSAEEQATMGSLRALGGVSKYPQRVKCASLAWHALHSALEAGPAVVSTDANAADVGGGA